MNAKGFDWIGLSCKKEVVLKWGFGIQKWVTEMCSVGREHLPKNITVITIFIHKLGLGEMT